MTRAFPASLLFHLLGLLLIIWFGSHVSRQVIPRRHTISVRVTQRLQPRDIPPAREELLEPEPREEAKPPEAEPEPVVQEEVAPEPAVVPEEPERREEVVEPETEPVVEQTAPAAVDPAPAETAEAGPTPVVGTDVMVPARFRYYIDLLEARVARNWHPKQLGFRSQSIRVCKVHFHVEQNGMITRETIVQTSGVPLMDRESLKAVKAVGRFMPLPRGLADNALGVTYTFTLTVGN